MPSRRFRPILVLVTLWLPLLLSADGVGALSFTPIALSGDSPVGIFGIATYTTFPGYALNDNEEVAFRGRSVEWPRLGGGARPEGPKARTR